jgi:hypothetical protein
LGFLEDHPIIFLIFAAYSVGRLIIRIAKQLTNPEECSDEDYFEDWPG